MKITAGGTGRGIARSQTRLDRNGGGTVVYDVVAAHARLDNWTTPVQRALSVCAKAVGRLTGQSDRGETPEYSSTLQKAGSVDPEVQFELGVLPVRGLRKTSLHRLNGYTRRLCWGTLVSILGAMGGCRHGVSMKLFTASER